LLLGFLWFLAVVIQLADVTQVALCYVVAVATSAVWPLGCYTQRAPLFGDQREVCVALAVHGQYLSGLGQSIC